MPSKQRLNKVYSTRSFQTSIAIDTDDELTVYASDTRPIEGNVSPNTMLQSFLSELFTTYFS